MSSPNSVSSKDNSDHQLIPMRNLHILFPEKPYIPRINYEILSNEFLKSQSIKRKQISNESESFSCSSSNSSSPEPSKRINHKEKEEQKLKYRTELCKFYEINGTCRFGENCIFAHGKENLRVKVLNKSGYKKRQCINFFEQGVCPYGNRCQFSHEIRSSNSILNNYGQDQNSYSCFSYKNFIELSSLGSLKSSSEIKNRPRLEVFCNINKKYNYNYGFNSQSKKEIKKLIKKRQKEFKNKFDYVKDVIEYSKEKEYDKINVKDSLDTTKDSKTEKNYIYFEEEF